MAEVSVNKILDNEEFIKKLSDACGIEIKKEQIASCFYVIMIQHNEEAETFIDGKVIIDGSPYKQNVHGNLINVAKRYLRNQEAFQFNEAFIDMIYEKG